MKEMKIAKIISTTAVVINAGSKDGITANSKFEIIGKRGTAEIIDPDTGESLGSLDSLKGKVHATKVYPNMTIAESSYSRSSISPMGSMQDATFSAVNSALTGFYGVSTQKELNVDMDQITGGMPFDENQPIQIGDIVVFDED